MEILNKREYEIRISSNKKIANLFCDYEFLNIKLLKAILNRLHLNFDHITFDQSQYYIYFNTPIDQKQYKTCGEILDFLDWFSKFCEKNPKIICDLNGLLDYYFNKSILN